MKIQGDKAFKEMRKFTFAEMLAARFWFLEKKNIKKETIAEKIGISVTELEEILDSEAYREAVERLIISARTPSKLKEWINIYGDSKLSWFARRMWLPETVVSEMIERIKRNIGKTHTGN